MKQLHNLLKHLQPQQDVIPVLVSLYYSLLRIIKTFILSVKKAIIQFIHIVLDRFNTCQRLYNDYSPTVIERSTQYALLCRLHKPVGIWLLLWPTLWGLWIAAEGYPGTPLLLVFVLGVILMRSAGCVLNDMSDRNYDRYVERTHDRPICNNKISLKEAVLLTIGLVLAAFLLVLTTNGFTIKLSFAALCLAIIYPFMKRYTYLPQFVLGLAFGWSIPMAFAAVNGTINEIAWLILACNVLWSVSYDTMYAMVDRDEDLKIGVKSTAILFGEADRLIIGIIQCMFLLGMGLVGSKLGMGHYYFSGLFLAIVLCFYHQYLIRERTQEQCFKAFVNNHYIGMVLFLGLFFNYL